jgi:hypothetical protein
MSLVSIPLSTEWAIALNASTNKSRLLLSAKAPNFDIPAPTKATPLASFGALRLMVPPSKSSQLVAVQVAAHHRVMKIGMPMPFVVSLSNHERPFDRPVLS